VALPCPACGFSNEPGEKFCGGCGALLQSPSTVAQPTFASPQSYTPKHLAEKILTSKSALEGERKQVTVLFADLKGSMELLADRDPEEARKLLDPVLERIRSFLRSWRMGLGWWRDLGILLWAMRGLSAKTARHGARRPATPARSLGSHAARGRARISRAWCSACRPDSTSRRHAGSVIGRRSLRGGVT
jgi:hypothetical protein